MDGVCTSICVSSLVPSGDYYDNVIEGVRRDRFCLSSPIILRFANAVPLNILHALFYQLTNIIKVVCLQNNPIKNNKKNGVETFISHFVMCIYRTRMSGRI